MKNYLSINDHRIELTDEQVAQLRDSFEPTDGKLKVAPNTVRLGDVPAAETVKIGNHEMIVLEQLGTATLLLRKDLLAECSEFGANNNYDGSYVDEICQGFSKEIADIVGEDNVMPHDVDLTSDDGLKDYGVVRRRASLITADMYRRFVEILDKFKIDGYWWLATPHSTEKHGNASWIKCVSPSGCISNDDYIYDFGVRPFCILKSNIFVSK